MIRTSSHEDDLAGEVRQLLLGTPIEGHDELVAAVDDLGAQRVDVKRCSIASSGVCV